MSSLIVEVFFMMLHLFSVNLSAHVCQETKHLMLLKVGASSIF